MFKNVASQKVAFFAFIPSTSLPKTGDAANITAYVSKDFGTVTVLGDTSATEADATNSKGVYWFDLTQSETNADFLQFSAKSSTSDVSLVPVHLYTTPNRFSTMVIDAAGLADATTVKIGPTGAATAQTARDNGLSVLISSGTGTGQLDVSSGAIKIQGPIKKGAARAAFPFVMYDSTTHAAKPGVTVGTIIVTRALDGGSDAAGTLGSVTAQGNGVYLVDFASGDTNGNSIVFKASATGCDMTVERIFPET